MDWKKNDKIIMLKWLEVCWTIGNGHFLGSITVAIDKVIKG